MRSGTDWDSAGEESVRSALNRQDLQSSPPGDLSVMVFSPPRH